MSTVTPRVALVALPWADLSEPSLGLAILKGQLEKEGIECRVFHLYLDILERLTPETYRFFSEEWGLNEFLFTGLLQHDVSDAQIDALLRTAEGMRQRHSRYREPLEIAEAVLRIREKTMPEFLRQACDKVLAFRPTLVGLTCMFDQTIASIALGRLIKDASPSTMIALGGYALEGPPPPAMLCSGPFHGSTPLRVVMANP